MFTLRILILLFLSASLKAQTAYKTPSILEAAEQGLQPCKVCKPASVAPQSSKPQGTGTATTQCKGLTKSGTRCKHMTRIGNGYCFQHQPK